MGKIVTLVLGLAAISGAAYYVLEGGAGGRGSPSAQRRQLDHVREAAQRMEEDAQRRVDGLLERTR